MQKTGFDIHDSQKILQNTSTWTQGRNSKQFSPFKNIFVSQLLFEGTRSRTRPSRRWKPKQAGEENSRHATSGIHHTDATSAYSSSTRPRGRMPSLKRENLSWSTAATAQLTAAPFTTGLSLLNPATETCCWGAFSAFSDGTSTVHSFCALIWT